MLTLRSSTHVGNPSSTSPKRNTSAKTTPILLKISRPRPTLKVDRQLAKVSADDLRSEALTSRAAHDITLPQASSKLHTILGPPKILIDTSYLTQAPPEHLDTLSHLRHLPRTSQNLLVPTPHPHAHYWYHWGSMGGIHTRRAAASIAKKAEPNTAVDLKYEPWDIAKKGGDGKSAEPKSQKTTKMRFKPK
ncbi:hypothetical protein P7C70_g4489, partial [Phenoliferia sp. Uapishka_3]